MTRGSRVAGRRQRRKRDVVVVCTCDDERAMLALHEQGCTGHSRSDTIALVGQPTHGELLLAALDGDQSAWDSLVGRFETLVWSVARSFRLDHATAMDVAQTVWLKLVESADRIDDPERLPGWLATTTRREALRVIEIRARQVPSDFEVERGSDDPPLDLMAIEDEEVRAVLRAHEDLDDRCRQLFSLICSDPPITYEIISEVTGMAIGSIGPTRDRCLRKLRAALVGDAGAAGGSDRGRA